LLDLGVIFLIAALALWISLVGYVIFKPRLSRREELSGGLPVLARYEEEWSGSMKNPYRRETLRDWDIKLIKKISLRGEATLEDIIAELGEISPVIGERIRRLEARGYIVKSPSGSYIITEGGRRFLEMMKEKEWYRRKEREILENM